LPSRCITTWDELTRAFLVKFSPPSKTISLRNQITNFTQNDEETLYEAWERFKDLIRLCPHHDLQCWMIIQPFYNGVYIDAAAGVTLMNKTEDEASNLIKEMALNNFQWSTKRDQPKQVGGKLKVDVLTLLSAKVDAMTQKLD